MKRLTLTTAVAALAAGAAVAATDIEAVDLTGDRFATMEELSYVFPGFDVEFFDDIDTNDDNRVSQDEILTQEAQEILARYDMIPLEQVTNKVILDDDGDGFISYEDMQRGYPEFTALDFESIDTNDDNRLSYGEVYALDAQNTIAKYEVGTIADISEIDTNGDAFADFDELVVVYPGLPMESFEQMDVNDDNRISADELYSEEAQEIVSRYES